MLRLIDAHKKQIKQYSFSKENNKFAKRLDLIPKETDIKDTAIEAAKIQRKKEKHTD